MRLIGYLHSILAEEYSQTELAFAEKTILRDCKPYLNILRSGKKILFRGSSAGNTYGSEPGLIKQKSFVDKERKPKDTPKWLHDYLNKKMKEVAGWPVRNGVSVTPEAWQAQDYGGLNLFFPIGKCSWAYMKNVYDLYAKLNTVLRDSASAILLDLKEKAQKEGKIKSREEVEEFIKDLYRGGIESKYYKASKEEKQEFDRITRFHTKETEKWEFRAGRSITNWKKSWMEKKEQWQALDYFLEGAIAVNTDWNNIGSGASFMDHRGEIMFNCKEYYLLGIRNRPTMDMRTLFQKLGIPPKSYKHSMPGNPAEWA